MSAATIGFVVLAVIILLIIARVVYRLILNTSMTEALIDRDNKAAAVALSGFLFGVMQVVIPVLSAPSHTFWSDVKGVAAYGIGGILAMSVTALVFEQYSKGTGVDLHKQICDGNAAAGISAAGIYIAASEIVAGVLTGDGGALGPTLVFWLAGTLALLILTHIFRQLTSYDDVVEINGGNLAAACGYAGLVIAIGMMTGKAVSGTFETYTTAFLGFGKMLLLTLVLYPVRQVIVQMLFLGGGFSFHKGRLDHEIAEDNNVGAGLLEAVGYLIAALVVTQIF